ncbi:hypothetical protein HII36_01480 [Nonomuraea sp. NN258]|uniref:hypothetical protein n=1 Tax=Nonomuraea antri TaxID=2730852 RepID=UPI001568630E|nr:hypothetical protein [Nonomuraea antri]NRQ30517.1 hypothetical protein [Nonomuraea antri]
MHWHAYTWLGNGADLAREGERRPTSPDFHTSALPPMRTGLWLAKPASRIAETFDDASKAVEWMSQTFGLHGVAEGQIPLESREALAADLLPRGVDVQWGEWLPGGRFITVGMVCCPNRHVSNPCPVSR